MKNPKEPANQPPIDLSTPSVPTPDIIETRREAQKKKEQAVIDWKRYQSDAAYCQEIDQQYRQQREMETQYQRTRAERDR